MTYVYIQSEAPHKDNDYRPLWTVGHYDPSGQWHSDTDHDNANEAARRCVWLNGGNVERYSRSPQNDQTHLHAWRDVTTGNLTYTEPDTYPDPQRYVRSKIKKTHAS